MGAIFPFLAALFAGKKIADDRAARETRTKTNQAALDAILTHAQTQATQLGKNILDTPELRKSLKSLGGDEAIVDVIGQLAQVSALEPEVIARRGIREGTTAPVPTPGQEGARASGRFEAGTTFEGTAPARTTPASPALVNQRIAGLSADDQAFAFPQRTAARLAGNAAALPGAQIEETKARANLQQTTARLAPADLANRQEQVANQARAIENEHADRLADVQARLAAVSVDRDRNAILREQADIERNYKSQILQVQEDQNRVARLQIAGQIAEKYAAGGVAAGDVARIHDQYVEILTPSSGRRRLDPDLEKVTGTNPHQANRLAQLSTQYSKAIDQLGTEIGKVTGAIAEGKIDVKKLGPLLANANEQINEALALQVAEARAGLIPREAIPADPRLRALEVNKGISTNGRILPLKDIMAADRVTSVSEINGAPKNFDQLFPPTTNPGQGYSSTVQGILGRVSGQQQPGTAAPTPDVPPAEYLKNLKSSRTNQRQQKEAQTEKDVIEAGALARSFNETNRSLPKGQQLARQHIAEYVDLVRRGNLTPNQAFNELLRKYGAR